MIVHIGVIIIAVALVASNSFTLVSELPLTAGQTAKYGGHTFELVDVTAFEDARAAGVRAEVRVDGGEVYAPRDHHLPQLRARSCRRRPCAAA